MTAKSRKKKKRKKWEALKWTQSTPRQKVNKGLCSTTVLITLFVTFVFLCLISQSSHSSQGSQSKSEAMNLDVSVSQIDFGTLDVGQSCSFSLDVKNPSRRPVFLKFESQKCNSFSLVSFPPVATLKPKDSLNVSVTLTPFVTMKINTSLVVYAKCKLYHHKAFFGRFFIFFPPSSF